MAGHSHSANIKFRKDRVDNARGKLFSKMSKEILSAAREGGGDPDANLRLRYAIDRAKAASVPRDNIARAIKKGIGELEGGTLEELLYEGYAPGGVAILIESLTDNRNRTAPEVRRALEKRGGNLAAAGAVAWMFERKSLFVVKRAEERGEDEMMELALEAGADDFKVVGEFYEVFGEPGDFHQIATGLAAEEIELAQSSIVWLPKNSVPVVDKDDAVKILELIDALEELDDVTNVSANYDIPEVILAEIHGN